MESVLRDRDALWIGWSGRYGGRCRRRSGAAHRVGGLQLDEVPLTKAEIEGYYEGCSNGAIWPLYHDAIVTPVYHRTQFQAYRRVNEKFARRVAEVAPRGALVWCTTTSCNGAADAAPVAPGPAHRLLSAHPLPPVEIFSQLPWRRQILEGLLGADLVGFQTREAALNFLRLVQRYLALRPGGDRVVVDELSGSRTVRVEAFPIGIRAEDFASKAEEPETLARAAEIRDLGSPDLILLGWTGSTTPRASTSASGRSPNFSRTRNSIRTPRCSSRWQRPAARTSTSTSASVTTSNCWSAGQR